MPTNTENLTSQNSDSLSIIIPFFNDEDLVKPLYVRLKEVFGNDGRYEFILVDDGSSDQTFEKLKSPCKEDRRFRAIKLNRNWGQQRAITEGLRIIKGKLAATMNPDLSINPADILMLADLMTFGTELVNGYREKKHESLFGRRLPSFIANKLLSLVSGVTMKDFASPMAVVRTGLVKETILKFPSGLFYKTLTAILAGSIREAPVCYAPQRKKRDNDTIPKYVRMFYFLFFSALELRLIRAGLSTEFIKAGLIWGLTVNGLFVVASLIAAPQFSLLFIAAFFLLAVFAQSVRKNDRRRRDPDPVAEIV